MALTGGQAHGSADAEQWFTNPLTRTMRILCKINKKIPHYKVFASTQDLFFAFFASLQSALAVRVRRNNSERANAIKLWIIFFGRGGRYIDSFD